MQYDSLHTLIAELRDTHCFESTKNFNKSRIPTANPYKHNVTNVLYLAVQEKF